MNCHRSLLFKLCFLFTKLPLGHNIQIHELERLQEYNFDKKIIITVAYLVCKIPTLPYGAFSEISEKMHCNWKGSNGKARLEYIML